MESESPYKSPESEVSGGGTESGDLTRAFLGPKNADYYLRQFDKLEHGGSAISWHWPACFVTWVWLGYRKMWGWFFAYWLIYPFIMYAVLLGFGMIDPFLGTVMYIAGYFLIPPLFANKLYYGNAQKKIARARLTGSDLHSQELEAARLGGTSAIALILLPIVLVVVIGILAAISIPAYQDYTVRAQVSEGLSLSGGAKAAVSEYVRNTGSLPYDNAEAGLASANEIQGMYTQSVAVYEGEITVTYGNDAHQLISGKELFLVPSESGGSIEWSCGSVDIEAKHLPAMCR